MLTNKIVKHGNFVTVFMKYKGATLDLCITSAQLKTITDSGVDTIGIYNYKNRLIARGRSTQDKKLQPMLHKLLDKSLESYSDALNLRDEVFIDDVVIVDEPVETANKANRVYKAAIVHVEPYDEVSAEPILGVSWNKRKNAYEAKATYSNNRRFLGYYKPEFVHIANDAVRAWISFGPEAYKQIMEIYYNLPGKERYKK